MSRRMVLIGVAVTLAMPVASSEAWAWGGAYHVGYTHYSPYTGLQHYGYTGAYRGYGLYGRYPYGYGAYGGYRYGGYRYGAYGYGGADYGARYGYYRRW
jgi:hypothetical protein